jgi:hypothetical protein
MIARKTHRFLSGQAMTELLITASTVLVPLLLLIPLLGKYIDIKHATIQAARYQSWEYTVWYAASGDTPSGFVDGGGTALPFPIKGTNQVRNESRRRFFSPTDAPITPADSTGTWNVDERNMLWTDHRGNPILTNNTSNDTIASQEDTPDYSLGILNVLLDIIDAVFEALAWVMNLVGKDVGFSMINTEGLAKSHIEVPITAPVGLIDFPTISDIPGTDDSTAALNINYVASAAVLTDGWNAGGLGHTINQTGGMVPTKILKELISSIPGLDTVWDVVSLLIPEWRRCNPSIPHFMDRNYGTVARWNDGTKSYDTYADGALNNNGSLWLGYMNIDAVHPDRLEGGGSHACPDGICNFDPEPVYADCEI